MNNWMNSFAFAAAMTLISELKDMERQELQAEKARQMRLDNRSHLPRIPYNTSDVSNSFTRLSGIVDSLIIAADKASNTKSDITAEPVISHMFYYAVSEAVNDTSAEVSQKIKVYDFMIKYCKVPEGFTGSMIFGYSSEECTNMLRDLFDTGTSMVFEAANACEDHDGVIGFIRLFAELLTAAEDAAYKEFHNFKFTKRPALYVLDRVRESLTAQMRKMEEENPELKSSKTFSDKKESSFDALLKKARSYKERGMWNEAEFYYQKVLSDNPQHWEATFFSVFCSLAVSSPSSVRVGSIPSNAQRITEVTRKSIALAKEQLYTNLEIVSGLSIILQSLLNQTTHYFTATMDFFRAFSDDPSAVSDKIKRVTALIDMIFYIGDSFEKHFYGNRDIIEVTAYACWNLGITLYENCDMPQPDSLYSHWLLLKHYNPDYECSKPIY